MVCYKDFAAARSAAAPTSYFEAAKEAALNRRLVGFESIEMVLLRANEWIKNGNINVINIETIITPTNPKESVSIQPSYGAMCFQIVRIWYKCG